jgi:hypothetical protein
MFEAAVICLIGFASGAGCTLLIRRLTNPEQIRSALNSIVACLFEFRLFADQPAVIMRAQWRLIAANARLLRCILLPSIILALPYWGLLATMEGVFGRLPLKAGDATVVTVQCRSARDVFSKIELASASGMAIETPAVRILRDAQMSWRVRALKAVSAEVLLSVDGRTIVKTISAGNTFRSFLSHPLELLPLRDPAIASIRVVYPTDYTWLIWFSLASLAGALLPLFS